MEYSVWPAEVPTVSTALWGQADWQKYEEKYRPEGYKGGQYDEKAWKAWLSTKKHLK